MKKKALSAFKAWVLVALISTVFSALLYVSFQQYIRQTANDPQIQMAEDAALLLAKGKSAYSIVPNEDIDISLSLAPFIIVYNAQGDALTSSGMINDKTPVIPKGVLDYAKQYGENRVTWQPEKGVRIAAVIKSYKGSNEGFVLVGRSLREIEKRDIQLVAQIVTAWFATLIGSFAVLFLVL